MKKEIEVTRKMTVWVCDFCGERTFSACLICRRHICGECAHEVYDIGDYPDRYCQPCWNAGEPFRRKKESLENHFDAQAQALDEGWIRVAKRLAKGVK